MTKRVGEFGENDGKKQKLNDDLWGDDLNVEDIDDCLELASQIIEKVREHTLNRTITLNTVAFCGRTNLLAHRRTT